MATRMLSVRVLAVALALMLARGAGAADWTTVRFPSTDAAGTTIEGALFRPAAPGRSPAVVMMHGCSGLYTKSGRMQTNLAAWFERFAGWGYVVLAVDGFNPRGFRSICETANRPIDEIDDRPFDAYGALAWLAAQPFVHADQVALTGWSHGGIAALAAVDVRTADRFGAEGRRFRAAAVLYPGCTRLEKSGDWHPYGRLLVMVGLADDWTAPKPCLRLIGAAKSSGAEAEIVAFDGAYHAFDHPALKLRTRTARNASWRNSERKVHIGADPEAREEAVRRMRAFLAAAVGGPARD